MTNQELTIYVRQVSQKYFGKNFEHEAIWNGRLRSSGGRFFPRDCHLDFNPKMENHPAFEQIVLHELCHYHLYRAKAGYKHRDADFKSLLAQVGGSRFAPRLAENQPPLLYICPNCGAQYPRYRKLDLRRFRCGVCRGNLRRAENL